MRHLLFGIFAFAAIAAGTAVSSPAEARRYQEGNVVYHAPCTIGGRMIYDRRDCRDHAIGRYQRRQGAIHERYGYSRSRGISEGCVIDGEYVRSERACASVRRMARGGDRHGRRSEGRLTRHVERGVETGVERGISRGLECAIARAIANDDHICSRGHPPRQMRRPPPRRQDCRPHRHERHGPRCGRCH